MRRACAIPEHLRTLLSRDISPESHNLAGLIDTAAAEKISGIAYTKNGGGELYLLFIAGEPAGAVYVDDSGELFGDKAVIRISGSEAFQLVTLDPGALEPVAASCRIHDPTHLKKHLCTDIPEIGKRSAAAGVLTVMVVQEGIPLPGVHVSIRRGRQMVGQNVTTQDGTAVFRTFPGEYKCLVLDGSQRITTHQVRFAGPFATVTIEIGGA
jgi:hypothetical protein